jgi:carboxynorspermidine decarboxylase
MGCQRLEEASMKAPSPCFLIDEVKLEENLAILSKVQREADVCILLALKAYALWKSFPLISSTLAGACAGSLFEARLAREKFGKEVHTYSPAFRDEEFPHILRDSDYIIFNSLSQLQHFRPAVTKSRVSVGIRVNPEVQTPGVKYEAYNACARRSRLGITKKQLEGNDLSGVTGFHVHALCEQGVDAFEALLEAFVASFGQYLPKLTWVNFGGGNLITDESYDRARLVRCLRGFRERYPNILRIYLEPGEAVVLNAGYLVARVLDIIRNELDIAVLDISAEAHLPDVLLTRHEPASYVPKILGAGPSRKFEFTYILGGSSCAAGDVIGEYSFPRPLQVGSRLIFTDMAHYSMVKTSMFCGVGHPAIALFSGDGSLSLLRSFTYSDYLARLC